MIFVQIDEKGSKLLLAQVIKFTYYSTLLKWTSGLATKNLITDDQVARLINENLALKAQVLALRSELRRIKGPTPKVSVRTRALQVFAAIITRGNAPFQKYYLSACKNTLKKWESKFAKLRNEDPCKKSGRPRTLWEIEVLVVRFKKENPLWGTPRIQKQLFRVGIRISQGTITRILLDNGLDPNGKEFDWMKFRSTVRDAAWALDYFFVRKARGGWCSVLLIIDLCTREVVGLKALDNQWPSAQVTVQAFCKSIVRESRSPQRIVHDRGVHFLGHFAQQMDVLEIEDIKTPPPLPVINCIAERAIKTVRFELTNHIRPKDVVELGGVNLHSG